MDIHSAIYVSVSVRLFVTHCIETTGRIELNFSKTTEVYLVPYTELIFLLFVPARQPSQVLSA